MSAGEEKKFMIKHIFLDASNLKIGKLYFGATEHHFDTPWRIYIFDKAATGLSFYLECLNPSEKWAIDAKVLLKFYNMSTQKTEFFSAKQELSEEMNVIKMSKNLRADELEKYLMDGNLCVEMLVTIPEKSENIELVEPVLSHLKVIKSDPDSRYFVIKQVFTNVMDLAQYSFGRCQFRCDIPWRTYLYHTIDGINLYLECLKPQGLSDWRIQTDIQFKLTNSTQQLFTERTSHRFGSRSKLSSTHGPIMLNSGELKKFLDSQGNLNVECHVAVVKTRGIRDRLRRFDKPHQVGAEVGLVVDGRKFYVNKVYIASHSNYFKALLDPHFSRQEALEISVSSINPDDFQWFLELIHGESDIDEFTLKPVVYLAGMLKSKSALRRCEEFLMEKSKRSLKCKLQMAVDYGLDKLKKKCLSELKTTLDIHRVLPKDAHQLDPEMWAELLKMAISLK